MAELPIYRFPDASVGFPAHQRVHGVKQRSISRQQQPGHIDPAQCSVQMVILFGIAAGLTLIETRELLSVAKQQLDLKPQVIVVGDLAGQLLLIR